MCIVTTALLSTVEIIKVNILLFEKLKNEFEFFLFFLFFFLKGKVYQINRQLVTKQMLKGLFYFLSTFNYREARRREREKSLGVIIVKENNTPN